MRAGFCAECNENVYLDDSGNCVKGHQASSIRDVYEAGVAGESAAAVVVPSKQTVPVFKRPWFLPIAMLLVGLILGVGMASGGADDKTPDLLAQVAGLEAKVDDLTAERDALEEARDALEEERDELAEELDPIKREEAAAAAEAKAAADAEEKAKADAEAAAAAAAAAASAEVEANTFRAGVYLVGVDMKAGRYKGTVIGDMGYWAVLADPNGSDILENNIVEGPFYVEVRDGQYLELDSVEITLNR
ncbi:MAG: hypothetical protein ACYC2X_07320 [Coriobacteriia bacterium]